MRLAMREAEKACAAGEVPCGCVIVKNGQVIARGRNQVETLKDATAHAEMLALAAAQAAVGDWRLEGCTIYATKEPCPMCAGAMVHCRPSRVVFGIRDAKAGACGGWIHLLDSNPPLNHACSVQGGVLEEECLHQLRQFFRNARATARLSKRQRQAPSIGLGCHAESGWVTSKLLKRYKTALQALLPELLATPPGPAHVLSGLPLIEIAIVDDETIARVHAEFLHDPGATDVITFPYGEILASCDTAERYAAAHGLNREEELFRYLVHGLVHLHGHLDADPQQRAALFAVQEPLVARYFPA